ncbi:hypothetical protein ISF_04586 [Cordyceps fumosorosea ARSEF 2679]|uniref:Uncharacterized protein n=1 Tax=Cordyceps fumosorosea (strain ARSEF 2679) TaxID=1081104 RepID=A0A167WJP7_CORFA|nr:hypothetical protein ISF_04586 [Cordyceps fumosorosea ARSEF 2679]OAA63877.1 hypothetical protein ISF_04586 [Cordyceps fumosorosea ARSEF 2679]
MVSFFGLKFGSDKKKGLAKSGDKKGQDGWKATEPPELARGQFYGTSQPHEHLARPGTSYSSKGSTNWRQTFKGFGANSSMVDLSRPMRKESVSSLRYPSSEANLRSPALNSSTTKLPLPSALGGSGHRVGTPDRPSTASGHTKEWVNPLDVHFCKNTIGVPVPSSVHTDGPVKSPLAMQFGVDDDEGDVVKPSSPPKDNALPVKEMTLTHGYPSPPQSVNNAEQVLSPSVSDFSTSGKTHGDPSSLPSPATTVPRTSEDRWEAPVIRNVLAKRDTTTFHSPRRRSFTMDLEQQELEKLRKQRQTEGFAGSFADFDFGEIITKQASIEQFPEPPSTIYAASPDLEPFPTFKKDQTPTTKPENAFISSAHTATKGPEGELGTFQRDTEARAMNNSPELITNSFRLPPPAPVPAPRTTAPRPATLYGLVGGAPAAAAGAHPGNSPMSTFEPPPRLGFRARLGSDASSRRKTGPPKPLKTSSSQPSLRHKTVLPTAHHDEPSPKSSFPPTLNGANQYPSNEASKRSLDMKSPKSPYNMLALEGDFPVTKGLPRGRQPPRRPARSDEASSPERPDFSLPDWGLIDSAEPRHSAMPPPLATNSQPRPSISSAIDMNLPSPSFASLELSISSSGESLTQAFEDALEKTALSPGLVGDFFAVDTSCTSPTGNTTRVEAKKAPPRPAPVTLPPSPKKSTEPRSAPPTQSEFGNTFI